jgi:hypothetical protein
MDKRITRATVWTPENRLEFTTNREEAEANKPLILVDRICFWSEGGPESLCTITGEEERYYCGMPFTHNCVSEGEK